MLSAHIDKIGQFLKAQNHKCFICENEIEKPYLDVDYHEGIAYSVICFDCWNILGTSNFDSKYLNKIVKYIKYRDRIEQQCKHLEGATS